VRAHVPCLLPRLACGFLLLGPVCLDPRLPRTLLLPLLRVSRAPILPIAIVAPGLLLAMALELLLPLLAELGQRRLHCLLSLLLPA
jgi:hypothetical protein